MKRTVYLLTILFVVVFFASANAQHSVARQWNETLLEGIRTDFARPTVHSRNLFHVSTAMYDAWAVYDPYAETYFLGKTVDGFTCPFNGIAAPADVKAAQEEAISFAVYRIMRHRFQTSPGGANLLVKMNELMNELGYDPANTSLDYSTGDPAALGNYLADELISFGLQDGSNEQFGYANLFYEPVNEPLVIKEQGNPTLTDFDRWQPITLDLFIDQSGNPIPFNTPDFLGPEWGQVAPFSLKQEDVTVYQRDGFDYKVYHDPGAPPHHSMTVGGLDDPYKWNYALVSIWSAHLQASDTDLIDISPASIGNISVDQYPTSFQDLPNFYDLLEGGDPGEGYDINPVTGQPYEEQWVSRGDYGRVLAEFWADGPASETPPGHWFTILNYVNDHPLFEKRFRGEGPILDDLEWDVKAYFMLGGTMHDVAVTAWGIKGWYDYIRPVSAIRGMAELGQSSDPNLPNYHPGGLPLVPGYIEMVEAGDPLAMDTVANIGKVKVKAWRGPDYITNPATDEAGVGWILAEYWWPYQRPSFVTPPFAGYISGHSTFSRAAAEMMTLLTGDAYFPGGMGEFDAPQNEFLVFEEGPSQDLVLQWATYRDASDQCSLSRIWGGIHPPADDIPGRLIGLEIGVEAFEFAESYFFKDEDEDGVTNVYDCDDQNPAVYPGAAEICDGLDNDCNGMVDDGLTLTTYYLDADNDGFGDALAATVESCQAIAPIGYATNSDDCDDTDANIHPGAAEICDGLDNDCNGLSDDGLVLYEYYPDADNDGFGDDAADAFETCQAIAPVGFVGNNFDCDDSNADFNPDAPEICDDLDNNCNGLVDDGLPTVTWYLDGDNDGYGAPMFPFTTCDVANVPSGYVDNDLDCLDSDPDVNPDGVEVLDGLDNDCNGMVDDVSATGDLSKLSRKLYPNPVQHTLTIEYQYAGELSVAVFRTDGARTQVSVHDFTTGRAVLDLGHLPQGVYLLQVSDLDGRRHFVERVVR